MICYRDRWFCPFHVDCLDAADCSRPLTQQVLDAAAKLGLDISQPSTPPECHRPNGLSPKEPCDAPS
jgi:hypothetical protein